MSLFRLAEADLAAQRPAQAAANAEMALTVLRGIGGEWRRGNVLIVLASPERYRPLRPGPGLWRESLDIFETLGAPEAATVRALLNPLAVAGLRGRAHAWTFIVRLSPPGTLNESIRRVGADGAT